MTFARIAAGMARRAVSLAAPLAPAVIAALMILALVNAGNLLPVQAAPGGQYPVQPTATPTKVGIYPVQPTATQAAPATATPEPTAPPPPTATVPAVAPTSTTGVASATASPTGAAPTKPAVVSPTVPVATATRPAVATVARPQVLPPTFATPEPEQQGDNAVQAFLRTVIGGIGTIWLILGIALFAAGVVGIVWLFRSRGG